jgi:hypothetical protein
VSWGGTKGAGGDEGLQHAMQRAIAECIYARFLGSDDNPWEWPLGVVLWELKRSGEGGGTGTGSDTLNPSQGEFCCLC